MEFDMTLVIALAGIAGSGGIAWGGARVAMNGTKSLAKDTKAALEAHVEVDRLAQLDTVDRLARIETKLDDLLQRE